MSNYKIPLSQFEKLEISPKSSTTDRGHDVMPATTRSQLRRHATSSQASSSTGTGYHRSGSSSASRQSTHHSNQQQRQQMGQSQRIEQNVDEEVEGDGDGDGDDDDDDDGDDGDDSGDEPQFIMQPEDRLRIAEIMAAMTKMLFLPAEFLPTLNLPALPAHATVEMRLHHHVGRTLIRRLSSQASLNTFLGLGGIHRTQVLRLVVQNLQKRFDNVCDQLYRNERDPNDGRNVADTVTFLDDFQQNRLLLFANMYRQRTLLANSVQDGLTEIVVDILVFVIRGDRDLYAHTAHQRTLDVADIYGGNLYRRWRALGNRQHLFATLNLLRNRIQQTGVRQTNPRFAWVDASLATKNDVVWADFNQAL